MKQKAWIVSLVVAMLCFGCESSDGGGGVGPSQEDTVGGDEGSQTTNVDTGSPSVPDTSLPDTSQPQPDTNTGPECTYHVEPAITDECQGDQICILDHGLGQPGHCEGAFGRLYKLVALAVHVSERDSEGACWDPLCGAPDLYLEARLDGQPILETETVEDVFEVDRFSTEGSTLIRSGDAIELRLYDADPDANDLIMGCQLNPVSADFLRLRLLGCEDPTGSRFYFVLTLL